MYDDENIETASSIEDETIQDLLMRTRENVYSCRQSLSEVISHLSGKHDIPVYDDEQYFCLKDMILQIESASAYCKDFAEDICQTIFGR